MRRLWRQPIDETKKRDRANWQVALFMLVAVAGLEPARPLKQGILNPSCLPFHHTANDLLDSQARKKTQDIKELIWGDFFEGIVHSNPILILKPQVLQIH